MKSKSSSFDSDPTVIVGGPTLAAVVLCLVIGVVFGSAFTYVIMTRAAVERDRANIRSMATQGGTPAAELRNLAGYLEGKGMTESAIEQYRRYLDRNPLSPADRAQVCVKIAELAMVTEDYTQALEYAYQAELLHPSSPLQSEIDRIVIGSLRATGDADALAREQAARGIVEAASDAEAPLIPTQVEQLNP